MDFIKQELDKLKEQGLYRQLKIISSAAEPIIKVNGKEMLLLASNNYLGLANHPKLRERAVKTIEKWGTGTGASRSVSGSTSLHEELEEKLAQFKGHEGAIIFNTGYMANVGVISSLMGPDDTIFIDKLNHASIIDGARLSKAKLRVYKHNDIKDLEKKLKTTYKGRKLIVTDGVFSMDGDIVLLPEIVELKKKYDCILMIDDAHSTGVLGEKGKGTAEYYNLMDGVDIHLGTLSKALGTEGGFVTGSSDLIDYLRNKARTFIYSTAIAPSTIGAAIASLEVIVEEAWRISRLNENAQYLRMGLRDIGFEIPLGHTPIIPVLIGSNENTLIFSKELEELGILAPAIRPPTVPKGTGRIRVTVMADHSQEQLERAIEAFKKTGRKLRLI